MYDEMAELDWSRVAAENELGQWTPDMWHVEARWTNTAISSISSFGFFDRVVDFDFVCTKSWTGKPTCPNRLRSSSSSSSRFAGQGRKDRESEGEAVKLEVKTRCAEALRFLSRGNLSNSTRITENKGLLVLARHVKNERGELQLHCLF
ncbi:hypothetical protein Syun_019319 [Stephania yunnanensis]|uniref:Uncharacterized protein n=1 Tax=Stephania yunnanensis TaxID=152371 RepID=A0AAP0NVT5_9MAGN